MIKKIARFFAEYFVFVVNLVFIFVIAAVYGFLDAGGYVNVIFLLLVIVWIIYQIKYFWDLLGKKSKANSHLEGNIKIQVPKGFDPKK